MKYRSYASVALVIFTFAVPALICFPILFIPIFSSSQILLKLTTIIVIYVALWLVCFSIYRNAYCPFEMDFWGIKNRRTMIFWNQIKRCDIITVELLKYSLLPTIRLDFLVFGLEEIIYDDFINLNPQKCIFFSISRRNVSKLVKYGKGKNLLIDSFLQRQKDTGDGSVCK